MAYTKVIEYKGIPITEKNAVANWDLQKKLAHISADQC